MASNLDGKFATLHEIVRAARHNLAPGPWDYLIGGTETETTLRRNRQALDSIAFRPRVLRDVSKIDTSATLFGRSVRIPVMLAPIGSIETFTEGGGATAAKEIGRASCRERVEEEAVVVRLEKNIGRGSNVVFATSAKI